MLGLEASIETNSPLENWAIFLKEADDPQKQEVIRKLTEKEAGLMQAQKAFRFLISHFPFYFFSCLTPKVEDRLK